jgi:hypothetical protein
MDAYMMSREDLEKRIAELELENATLRSQNNGHAERIAAQSELLTKSAAYSPFTARRISDAESAALDLAVGGGGILGEMG